MRNAARSKPTRARKTAVKTVAISILAGGLSSRMGHDKSGLRLHGRTLLGHVRAAAGTLGHPVRVVRRDLISRSGPLGGVYTALKRSRAEAHLFLACDMPFVSPALLRRIELSLEPARLGAFAVLDGRAGFPFALRREALPIVEEQLRRKVFSLQALASALKARRVRVSRRRRHELFNLNTPQDWAEAERIRGPARPAR